MNGSSHGPPHALGGDDEEDEERDEDGDAVDEPPVALQARLREAFEA